MRPLSPLLCYSAAPQSHGPGPAQSAVPGRDWPRLVREGEPLTWAAGGAGSTGPSFPGRWRGAGIDLLRLGTAPAPGTPLQVSTLLGPFLRSLGSLAPSQLPWDQRLVGAPKRAGRREQGEPSAPGFSLTLRLGTAPLPHCGPPESTKDKERQYYSQEGSQGTGPDPILRMSKARRRKSSA